MALFVLAPLACMTRASMLAVLGADFVCTDAVTGLPCRRIIVTYAPRNATLPAITTTTITITGIVFCPMLGANVLVERCSPGPASPPTRSTRCRRPITRRCRPSCDCPPGPACAGCAHPA